MKTKLEYIWLDGYEPTQNMRSKTKVVEDFSGKLEDCPIWCFDGSSTRQAKGGSSDCLLKPVAIYPDPDRINGFLVMTEVLNADGTPHKSNARAKIDDNVVHYRTEKGLRVEYDYKKYELVSSHTGRRTFCTLKMKENVPIGLIMSVSGHKSYKSFFKYLKIAKPLIYILNLNY